ncbi:hypothetical protein DPMN_016219 [Dreissena polymorpha]|uniref:Uncharacterized protein n=1 Tax=Dreissena polymorpha TaxID=45954 RepID=A0A9D4NF71_DREPO|nr:hypothetical protein DPMN_016219 [Dreissena polymorpha]
MTTNNCAKVQLAWFGHQTLCKAVFQGFPANLEIRENLDKDFHLFQSGKSQGIREKFLKSGKSQEIFFGVRNGGLFTSTQFPYRGHEVETVSPGQEVESFDLCKHGMRGASRDYQELVCFLESTTYPERMQGNSSKADKNLRDNFRSKAKKFFVKATESPNRTTLSRLSYCLTWSQFKRENKWTPRTVTRIQDIVSHRITQPHDTFQTVVLFDVVAV